jgi:hypothetical protein
MLGGIERHGWPAPACVEEYSVRAGINSLDRQTLQRCVMEMESKPRKSVTYFIRCLHRDIGFIMLGLTLAYALSGVVLVYRETGFMKSAQHVEKELPSMLTPEELGQALHLRRFEVSGADGDVVFFRDGMGVSGGRYDRITGDVSYEAMQYPGWVDRLVHIHKLGSGKAMHVVSVAYGVLLSFLALSALFMYGGRSKGFRRGMTLSGVGLLLAVGVLAVV